MSQSLEELAETYLNLWEKHYESRWLDSSSLNKESNAAE